MAITIIKPTIHGQGVRQGSGPLSQPSALWPFWERDGLVLSDISGNGNDGVLTLFTGTGDWMPSETGTSLNFDGTNDHVIIDASNGLKFEGANDSFTVSMWIKPIDQGTFQALMWIQDANDDMWRVVIWNDDTIRASLDAIDFSSSSTITYGVWQHVVAVFDKDGSGQIYINGQANGTPVALNNEVMNLTTNDLSIGFETQSDVFPYEGQMAFAAIHPYALTAVEVNSLYRDPWGLITPRSNLLTFAASIGVGAAGSPWYYRLQEQAVA